MEKLVSRQVERAMLRAKNKNRMQQIKKLKLEITNEELTATSGLGPILDLFLESPLAQELAKCLPERESTRSLGSLNLALALISSFIYGHDCLDDLEEFREDPHMNSLFNEQFPAARTMGDFLRDFNEEHIVWLNEFLHKMSMSFRKQLAFGSEEKYRPGDLVIDIDSTSHVQEGAKMEGLDYNYKNEWCLDSQVLFDEQGFSHGLQLRPGNTKSGVGALDLLKMAFQEFKFRDKKFFRGDSAYCNQEIMNFCISQGISFTIAAHGNSHWETHIDEITEWTDWTYTEEEIARAAKQGKKLPEVQLGRIHYHPGWAPHLHLPIVVQRKRKENKEQLSLLDQNWEYYGIITNFDLHLHSYQEVVEFYRKRGNAENFIREEKYGYDLKHFPCQKLMANHAYALLAMVAHNILRWMSLATKPDKPHFAKKLRRRFVIIPGKVVSHARQLTLRITKRFYEEVMRLRKALQWKPCPAFSTA